MTPPDTLRTISIRPFAAILALAALAACGVDGDPQRPEPRPAVAPAVSEGESVTPA